MTVTRVLAFLRFNIYMTLWRFSFLRGLTPPVVTHCYFCPAHTSGQGVFNKQSLYPLLMIILRDEASIFSWEMCIKFQWGCCILSSSFGEYFVAQQNIMWCIVQYSWGIATEQKLCVLSTSPGKLHVCQLTRLKEVQPHFHWDLQKCSRLSQITLN